MSCHGLRPGTQQPPSMCSSAEGKLHTISTLAAWLVKAAHWMKMGGASEDQVWSLSVTLGQAGSATRAAAAEAQAALEMSTVQLLVGLSCCHSLWILRESAASTLSLSVVIGKPCSWPIASRVHHCACFCECDAHL